MAWTFVGVSTAAGVTGTPLTLAEPAGVRDGDLLIACISSRTTSSTSISNSGWTLVAEQKTNNILTDTSAIASGAMFRRVREGTTDLTFTLPASGTSICFGRMIAYRGVAQASPVDVSTAVTTATNTLSVSVTGLTTTQANDLIVAMCAGGQEAAWSVFDAVTDPSVASGATDTSTAPTAGTWIERADSSTTTGADTSLAIFDAIKASAGATGNLTATASLGAGHVVIAGAFKISPAATADAWDISDKTPSASLSNSDKTATSVGSTVYVRSSTKRANGAAGKYYAEFVAHELTSGLRVGISNATADYPTANAFCVESGGIVVVDGVSSAVNLGGPAADGDIFGVAWDAGAERVWFRRNSGLWNNDASADPATNTNGVDVSAHASVDHALWARLDASGVSVTVRTETAELTYTGPSGFTSWMGEALGAATTDAVGTAAGSGAATATSEATKQTDGTAAGTSTATAAVGGATKQTDGTAAGVGAATAVGESGVATTIVAGDGTAAGAGAATAQGAQTAGAPGIAAGVGTAAATGQRVLQAVGTALGVGTASAVGEKIAAATGTAAGVGAASATGQQVKPANGTATGTGTATAEGTTGAAAVSTTGTAAGIGAATAVGAQTAATTGTAAGAGTAAAVSSGAAFVSGTGTAAGSGSASATGEQIKPATGTAAGTGTATATGFAAGVKPAIGLAQGAGTAAAFSSGAVIASGDGIAAGTGTAAATTLLVKAVTGTASGTGTATATGAQRATAAGSASGIGNASAASEEASAAVSAAGTAAGSGSASATGAQTAAAQGTAAGRGEAEAVTGSAALVSSVGVASSSSLAWAGSTAEVSPPLAGQVIVLAADNRSIEQAAENRTIAVDAENRTIMQTAEDRTLEAEGDDRMIEPEGGAMLLAA